MIPGFTTSVEFNGKAYQVQTEDKGPSRAMVVSLVYDGGSVVLSKRSTYSELLGADPDPDALDKKLKHQHKVLCAAVAAGKLDDLIRLGERQRPGTSSKSDAKVPVGSAVIAPVRSQSDKLSVKVDRNIRFFGGDEKTVEVRVLRGTGEEPVRGAQVSIKIVGASFRPQIFHAGTDSKGCAKINLRLPSFASGRGAVIFKAVTEGHVCELRRVLRPGPSR